MTATETRMKLQELQQSNDFHVRAEAFDKYMLDIVSSGGTLEVPGTTAKLTKKIANILAYHKVTGGVNPEWLANTIATQIRLLVAPMEKELIRLNQKS